MFKPIRSSQSPATPSYMLKKRTDGYTLYRNNRVLGLYAERVASERGTITVTYIPAIRPNEVPVTHYIPARYFKTEVPGVAAKSAPATRTTAA